MGKNDVDMKDEIKIISILGTKYRIFRRTEKDDPVLKGKDGYTDYTDKTIVVETTTDNFEVKYPEDYYAAVLRHEIVHAFLYESGLSSQTWAENEEIVDWIALQFPKMQKVFSEISQNEKEMKQE